MDTKSYMLINEFHFCNSWMYLSCAIKKIMITLNMCTLSSSRNRILLKPFQFSSVQFSSVQSLSCVWLFVTPWIAARQASLSITNSRSSLRLTSIKSVMPSSHLILCRPLFLLPPNPSLLDFAWLHVCSYPFKFMLFHFLVILPFMQTPLRDVDFTFVDDYKYSIPCIWPLWLAFLAIFKINAYQHMMLN